MWTFVAWYVLGNDGYTIAGLLQEEGGLQASDASAMGVDLLVRWSSRWTWRRGDTL